MHSYLFIGKVLPERAQISLTIKGIYLQTEKTKFVVDVNIINNQAVVQISSACKCDIFDLRNIVKTFVLNLLAIISYIKGFAYEFEVVRVYAPELSIDYVFGVEMPCLEQRGATIDLNNVLPDIFKKTSGPLGMFVNRCLHDLALSMKYADDTAFYCYCAIESLRQHCTIKDGLQSAKDAEKWNQFRQISGCSRESIDVIKSYADPLRHGTPCGTTSDERATIFKTTWDIVDDYLNAI